MKNTLEGINRSDDTEEQSSSERQNSGNISIKTTRKNNI